MNWKQLFNRSTSEERLEAVGLMLRAIETRPEMIIFYVDLRRVFFRLLFIGTISTVTLAVGFVTFNGLPELAAPTITMYLFSLATLLFIKPKRPQAHYLQAAR